MLTTTEVVRMIRKSGIVFDRVEIEAADVPFGIGSGSGVIFGVTGGVTEAVLRRLQQGHSRVDMEAIKKSGVRGDEGIKTLTYDYNGREIRAAVVNGLANAVKLLQKIRTMKRSMILWKYGMPAEAVHGRRPACKCRTENQKGQNERPV